jgi:hypothetical protein
MPTRHILPFALLLLTFGSTVEATTKKPANVKATEPQTLQKQIDALTAKIVAIEQLLAVPEVKGDDVLAPVLIEQQKTLVCHERRLQAHLQLLQVAPNLATMDLLDKVEAACIAAKRLETTKELNGSAPKNQAKLGGGPKAHKAGAPTGGSGNDKDAVSLPDLTELSSDSESKKNKAAGYGLTSDAIIIREVGDDTPCRAEDKKCITLDWQQKSPTLMPLRKSGDYRFHAINLNDILYQYTMTGEAPTPSTDDLSLFSGLVQEVQKSLLPSATPAKTPDTKFAEVAISKCAVPVLATNVAAAKTQVDRLNQALADLQPQATDKKYASIALSDTQPRVKALVDSFNSLSGVVVKLQENLNDPNIGGACEESVNAASALITDQFPKMRAQMEKLRDRYNQPHTLDQEFHCEQTIGCSMSILESYAGTATTATPNPWKSTQQATLSQLTLSGGFLLTTLQARSYSSRTAPDPTAPTTKTVNALGVDYSSGVRPALTALFNYHFPIPYLDFPKGGFALSAGPVIDISNGKADTSRFGFFGGVSTHLWNRFWITPGVHVGEFADTPQGFKGPGDIIPPNSGTPTPVKRFTARFAVAVTFQGGNPAALLGEKKSEETSTPSPGGAKSTSTNK